MTKIELLELLAFIEDDQEIEINSNGNYYELLDVIEEDGKAIILAF